MNHLLAVGSMISDAVLNNLITTLGSLATAAIPTLAVIFSGRRTRREVKKDVALAKDHVRRELRTVSAGETLPPMAPPAVAPDAIIQQLPAREPRRRP